MIKRSALVVILSLCLIPALLVAEDNLLANPGFEEDVLSQLAMWAPDAYFSNDEARRIFAFERMAHSGKRSLAVVNLRPNDSRVVQWLHVEPDSYYRITAWVMAEGPTTDLIAANISVLGSITASKDFKNTNGAWEQLELVGKTGIDQRFLGVTLRLGFYNNLVTGYAYFDDVFMEKIDAPPADVKVADFYSNSGSGTLINMTAATLEPEFPYQYLFIGIGAGLILIALVLFIILIVKRGRAKKPAKEPVHKAPGKIARPELRKITRKSMRISVMVEKRLAHGKVRVAELKSVNVSETGLMLTTDNLSLFSIDEKVELVAVYKRKKYELGAARIVRKQETYPRKGRPIRPGFGLAFFDTTAVQLKNIKFLLK